MTAPANFGWTPDPAGAEAFARSLSHGGRLARAAPHLLGDGEGVDLMPYLAFYETEIRTGEGKTWKQKGVEPPYPAQVGNNCTSRGDSGVMDLLQCMDAMTRADGERDEAVPHRTACEATYAFSLAVWGRSGDEGCTGHATAKSASQVGRITYREIESGPDEEDRARLKSWAANPKAVVEKYREVASSYRLPEAVQIRSAAEARAWLANSGLITVASDVGFETPRDAKGICERRGTWMHQMFICGYICSDGVPSFVIGQSWGPENPRGPRPFRLPSFCFRARESVVEAMLAQGDSWGHRRAPGFERAPLPARWKGVDWSGGA